MRQNADPIFDLVNISRFVGCDRPSRYIILVEALFFDFPESRQKVGELLVIFEQALPVLRQSRDSRLEN